MDEQSLNELEAAILKKRLKYLKEQGATGKRVAQRFEKDFLDDIDDDWEFCSALANLFAVKELRKRRYHYDEADDDQPSYAQSVVRHLLSDADKEPLEEQSDTAS